ncbi:MAG: archaemetzincin family Zn-dependent metalloprotease [candidate division WOR-3 bacterium]
MKSIYILPLGEIAPEILTAIKTELTNVFQVPTKILMPVANPSYAFEPKRCQYYSSKILKAISQYLPHDGLRVLGITEVDLCTPVLTFVFGEALLDGVAAVISLARLRQEFYQLPANMAILINRAVKEAIHELGHTFGLVHCNDSQCVISFSPNVLSVDHKGSNFCPLCQEILTNRIVEMIEPK